IAREITVPRQKSPMTRDFYEASCSGNADELWQMEQMLPVLAKRLASRMILKHKHHQNGSIDFRRTMRQSMGQGGVPIDLVVRKKQRDNPIIFALCDVSWSCLQFSYFSLAIVYALEKFFRQVRSFAFIGITDEITDLIKQEACQNLRTQTLSQANVFGKSGYTDYGGALDSFFQQYGRELTPRSQVLIFGDARTNWFGTRTEILREIRDRAKRVYWFNPEPQSDWGTGDSSMLAYQKYCHQVFACANLEQLAQAICVID
ncbi:MAG: VWA domain-containing protein, partial [Methylocystaceae bacterium]